MSADLVDFFLGQGGALAVAGAWIFFLQRQVSGLQTRLAQLETEHRESTSQTSARVLEVSAHMAASLQRSEEALVRLGGKTTSGNGTPSA